MCINKKLFLKICLFVPICTSWRTYSFLFKNKNFRSQPYLHILIQCQSCWFVVSSIKPKKLIIIRIKLVRVTEFGKLIERHIRYICIYVPSLINVQSYKYICLCINRFYVFLFTNFPQIQQFVMLNWYQKLEQIPKHIM